MSEQTDYHSYHIFIYPFKWELNKCKIGVFSEKTDLNRVCELFSQSHKSEWKNETFSFLDADIIANFSRKRFNEYNYFYDFTRNALYDFGNNESLKSNKDTLVKHFRYQPAIKKPLYYYIRKNKTWNEQNKPHECGVPEDSICNTYIDYRLEVEDIFINFYETGVGIITFHLYNYENPGKRSILNINKYGRRVNAPFLDYQKGISKTKEAELPEFLWITSQGGFNSKSSPQEKLFENFAFYENEKELNKQPFYVSKTISGLFAKEFFSYNHDNNIVKFEPVLDDRMFVLCWFGCAGISDEIKTAYNPKIAGDIKNSTGNLIARVYEDKAEQYIDSDYWYKYLFLDEESATCQNPEMRKRLLLEHTYLRWSDYATLYGITRYSFMSLTEPLVHLRKPEVNAAFLPVHVMTIYYKMTELAFVQRASLLKFSDEISAISGHLNENEISEQIKDLYKAYIEFINKIYFREITAQEQGIELYQLMHKVMQIPKNIEDLDKEFRELHDFEAMREQASQTQKANLLNIIATVFLPASFVAAIFGISTFDREITLLGGNVDWHFVLPLIITIIILFINALSMRKDIRKLF